MTGGWTSGLWKNPGNFFLPPATRKKPGRLRSWPPLWSRRGRKWTSLFSGIQRDGKQRDHTGPQSSRASALAGHQPGLFGHPQGGGPRGPRDLGKDILSSPGDVSDESHGRGRVADRKNGNHPVKQRISRAHSNRLTH